MTYPTSHCAEKKKAIIDSARKLFNRSGFDNVSLHQIMAGAGLTHGGFYSYFKSKSDLYTEVLGCFFTDPNWKRCWEGVEVDLSSTDVGSQVVCAPIYLDSISMTSRTLVRWWHCPRRSREVVCLPDAPSKPCFEL
jgi:DNA-binding transcriptional regulator YbjK